MITSSSNLKSTTIWDNLAVGVKDYVSNLQKGDHGVMKRVETMVNNIIFSIKLHASQLFQVAALKAEDPSLSVATVTQRIRTFFVDAVVEKVTEFIPDADAWREILMVSHYRTEVADYKEKFINHFREWMDHRPSDTDLSQYEASWINRMQEQRWTWGSRIQSFCKVVNTVYL